MKSTGIVRKVDELGRIVLPIELRRTLDIAEKDAIEIYVDGESIILKKYEPTCIFCGDGRNVGSSPACMKICVSMEVVVVLPWVPATQMAFLYACMM